MVTSDYGHLVLAFACSLAAVATLVWGVAKAWRSLPRAADPSGLPSVAAVWISGIVIALAAGHFLASRIDAAEIDQLRRNGVVANATVIDCEEEDDHEGAGRPTGWFYCSWQLPGEVGAPVVGRSHEGTRFPPRSTLQVTYVPGSPQVNRRAGPLVRDSSLHPAFSGILLLLGVVMLLALWNVRSIPSVGLHP